MTYNELWQKLADIYEPGEAKAIIRYILDKRFGMSTADIYCGKVTQLSSEETIELEKIINRLIKSEPVQYVLGEADFCGRTFNVRPGVLIPRPETAELCQWIISSNKNESPDILDIGTGSGCIAITLSLYIPQSKVSAWDVSKDAIDIARKNSATMNADINIKRADALNPPKDSKEWNIIVSNPPYICDKEKSEMEKNVLDYEPDIALFVPNSNPLLFYRSIATYSIEALKSGGSLYFEINPLYVMEIMDMLKELQFTNIESHNDQFGKQRFIRARKA